MDLASINYLAVLNALLKIPINESQKFPIITSLFTMDCNRCKLRR
jgi:hypothetical protein